MKRRPCWCTKTILWEMNSFLKQTLSFVPINLYRCWPREWKRSIAKHDDAEYCDRPPLTQERGPLRPENATSCKANLGWTTRKNTSRDFIDLRMLINSSYVRSWNTTFSGQFIYWIYFLLGCKRCWIQTLRGGGGGAVSKNFLFELCA